MGHPLFWGPPLAIGIGWVSLLFVNYLLKDRRSEKAEERVLDQIEDNRRERERENATAETTVMPVVVGESLGGPAQSPDLGRTTTDAEEAEVVATPSRPGRVRQITTASAQSTSRRAPSPYPRTAAS